ncbi:mobile mystery protein B [Microbaculum marinum]|uniref:Mobile mystery protein B n=1 Tax=Microbaculum marinum TaxID=1764581 RepID=A0AAW9RS68_9HYPH
MSDVPDETPEGATPLDPDEAQGLRFGHVRTQGELNELEQANIQSGLQWLARQRKPDILSDNFVRNLHDRLFGEVWRWAGAYRLTEKNIGVDPVTISVEVRNLLDDARYWAEHGTFDPVEQAVRLHHRLVFVHPFPNGNGRHARIFADAFLAHVHGEDAIDWAGGYDLRSVSDERRQQYLAALRAADRGDIGPLLDFAGHGR